jgi:DNA-binding MarR family transcriptional regulator
MSTTDDHAPPGFTEARNATLGHLLIKCARLFNERAVGRLDPQDGPTLRPSHMQVFAHVDFTGTRLTEIAHRMGITKQAVGQLVADLEQVGMFERVPDPTDGRARLVRFTEAGRQRLFFGLQVLKDVEAEVAPDVGQEHISALYAGLTRLLDVLEQSG